MKTLAFGFIGLTLLGSVGCAPPRFVGQPQLVNQNGTEYIYFVEQEQEKSSRLKKCDIHADNTVTCSTQFDLNN